MSVYKAIDSGRGLRYMVDGKLTGKAKIPAHILEALEVGKEIKDGEIEAPIDKSCVFCGMFGNFTRFMDSRTIYLCGDHYYEKTLGQIAAQLRKKSQEPQILAS